MMRQLWSKPLRGLAVVVGLVVTLAGCSGPEKAKPLDLGPNTALIGVRSAWSSSIGTVAAIDARTGGDLWRTALGVKLSAGVGSDGRYVSVVSNDNELITLDANKEIWRQKLGALTLTAPLVAGARVFVLSADRSVTAFDVATGRRLWQQQRTGEALVLRRSGLIMAVGDTLVVGLGGRLVGFQPLTGKVRWEAGVRTVLSIGGGLRGCRHRQSVVEQNCFRRSWCRWRRVNPVWYRE